VSQEFLRSYDGSEPVEVVIGDFGVSKVLEEEQDMTSTVLGTPIIFSPEMLIIQKYSYSNDIWALGVNIYTMLVGMPPFNGNNLDELLISTLKGKYLIPKCLNISLACRDFINQCL